MDKKKFKDVGGRWITQSLFLEFQYNTDLAVYTLDDNDKEYKGVIYPSIKRLYLECEDPIEYTFAKQHLGGWAHWQRLVDNAWVRKHVTEWREELEILLRSKAVQKMLDLCIEGENVQATKWVAEKGWDKRGPGRPTKKEQVHERKMHDRVLEEVQGDVIRLKDL